MALKIAVSGAGGYVGSCIAEFLENKGAEVIRLSSSSGSGKGSLHFSLGEPVNQESLSGIDALVHAAWDFRLTGWKDMERVNIRGSLELIRAAKRVGVRRIIFISTMSSFKGCRSMYGRAKLAVEKQAIKEGAIVLRPGLFYGKGQGGMTGTLKTVAGMLPVIPLPGGGAQVFRFCHSDDLGELIYRLCSSDEKVQKPVVCAGEKGFTFRQILKMLAAEEGKNPVFIAVPAFTAFLPLRMLEMIGIRTRLKSDSVIGLLYADPKPDFAEARRLRARFRDFGAGNKNKNNSAGRE